MTSAKQHIMWAVKSGSCVVEVAYRRKNAITQFLNTFANEWTWPHMVECGYRCVKVEVREVEK